MVFLSRSVAARRADDANDSRDRDRTGGERQPGLTEPGWPTHARPAQRAGDATRQDDAEERDGDLEGEADEEGGRREQPRQLAGVHEPLEVLLAGEPERGEHRRGPERAASEAPFLEREPHQPERRQDREDLRSMREVRVERSGLRSRHGIGQRVSREDPGCGHRGDESPREHPTCHRPG